jgi:hypothetical protein
MADEQILKAEQAKQAPAGYLAEEPAALPAGIEAAEVSDDSSVGQGPSSLSACNVHGA